MATEGIKQYLLRMWLKDREKGGVGWRTTREVADYFGIPTKEARKRLENDWTADLIDCERWGQNLVWRALATDFEAEIARLNTEAVA